MDKRIVAIFVILSALLCSGCVSQDKVVDSNPVQGSAVLTLSEALALANQPGWTLREAYGGLNDDAKSALTDDGKSSFWSFNFYKKDGACQEVYVDVVDGVAQSPQNAEKPDCSGGIELNAINIASLIKTSLSNGGSNVLSKNSVVSKSFLARASSVYIQYLIGVPPTGMYEYKFSMQKPDLPEKISYTKF